MLSLQMSSNDGCAVLRLRGPMCSVDDGDSASAAIALVGFEDHLVLDLRAVDRLSPVCARTIGATILDRLALAETVVVCEQADVRMQLVLAEVDRIAPLVATFEQAVGVLRVRTGGLVVHDESRVA